MTEPTEPLRRRPRSQGGFLSTARPWFPIVMGVANLVLALGFALQVDHYGALAVVGAVAFAVGGLGYLGSEVTRRRREMAQAERRAEP